MGQQPEEAAAPAKEKAEVVANCDHLQRPLFEAIRQLMEPLPKPRKRIGFAVESKA